MESINENLQFFSAEGQPLRASVSVSLTKQDVEVTFASASAVASPAGTQPQQQAREGDSVQAMSAREGHPEGWQERARGGDRGSAAHAGGHDAAEPERPPLSGVTAEPAGAKRWP
ncbi:MAG: hypothetical protein MZW92_40925 [Comamonadaceae bacterium]|nr:hypothetical protein [Comamonadaceae bacterium]